MTSALVPYIWVNLEALLLRVSRDGSGSCSAVLHLYVYCMEYRILLQHLYHQFLAL